MFSEKVANSIDALLAYWDAQRVCRYSNDAYLKWFGRKRAEMVDKVTMQELLGPLYLESLPFIEGPTRELFRSLKETRRCRMERSGTAWQPTLLTSKRVG